MSWPKGIYVATINLGVYYTDNFIDPSTQPTWTAVNTGLVNIGCREFKLDPFDPENKQYVLTESDRIIYRRFNQGSWISILTPAQADTVLSVSGCTISSFCTDPSLPGRLWALVGSPGLGQPPGNYWAIYTDDYGANWIATTVIPRGAYTYGMRTVRAYGDNVWASISSYVAGSSRICYSANCGLSWTEYGPTGITAPAMFQNPLEPARIYYSYDVIKYLEGGTIYTTNGSCTQDDDRMWFDPLDADHQRSIYGEHLFETHDRWSSATDIGATSIPVIGISKYSGTIGQMLVGLLLDLDHGQPQTIGAMTGAVTNVTGISGSMPSTAPYTDSIPNTCGNACLDGVQGVRATGAIYSHAVAMPGYAGDMRGTPLAGDRAVWQASDYPERHTDDKDTATGIHHTLGTGATQAAAGDHSHSHTDLTDIGTNTHAQIDDHIASTANPHSVTKAQVGLGNVANLLDNLTATTAPTANDDSADGYAVGSHWIDTTNDKAYVCLDATEGAAVWQELGPGGVDAADITYTPTVVADWDADVDPGNVDDALDQLAERVEDIENAGGAGSDASVITYTPAVPADWDGGTDPGNADDAFDQIAERVKDLEDGAVSEFTDLSDTPASYIGHGGKYVRVKSTEDGLDFIDPPAEGGLEIVDIGIIPNEDYGFGLISIGLEVSNIDYAIS